MKDHTRPYELPAKQVMTSLMAETTRLKKENDSLNAKLKELVVDLERVRLQLVLFQLGMPQRSDHDRTT